MFFYKLTIHYYNTKNTFGRNVKLQYTYNFRTYRGLKKVMALIDEDVREGRKVYSVKVDYGIMFE